MCLLEIITCFVKIYKKAPDSELFKEFWTKN